MFNQAQELKAPSDRMLYVWFEPWAEGLSFPPNMTVQLVAQSTVEGQLEIVVTPERTIVYGWRGCTLQVLVGGELVEDFTIAVPDTESALTMRESMELLFGDAPIPTIEEGSQWRKRPWWKFWAKQ